MILKWLLITLNILWSSDLISGINQEYQLIQHQLQDDDASCWCPDEFPPITTTIVAHISQIGFSQFDNFNDYVNIKIVGVRTTATFERQISNALKTLTPFTNIALLKSGLLLTEPLNISVRMQCCDKDYQIVSNLVLEPESPIKLQIAWKRDVGTNPFVVKFYTTICPGSHAKEDSNNLFCSPMPYLKLVDHGVPIAKIDFFPMKRVNKDGSWSKTVTISGPYSTAHSYQMTEEPSFDGDYGIPLQSNPLYVGFENGIYTLSLDDLFAGVPITQENLSNNTNFVLRIIGGFEGMSYNFMYPRTLRMPGFFASSSTISCFIPTNLPRGILIYSVFDASMPDAPLAIHGGEGKLKLSPGEEHVIASSLAPGTDYAIEWSFTPDDISVYVEVVDTSTIRTSCSCKGDFDAPGLLGVDGVDSTKQANGKVLFIFYGYSLCGNSYKFTRRHVLSDGSLDQDLAFSPNYFYHRGKACPTLYQPLGEAWDDLSLSKLIVGDRYQYEIRSSGEAYEGSPSYVFHKVLWESSVSGFVGTGKTKGNVPIGGVTVTWVLENPADHTIIKRGNAESAVNGKFAIKLKLDDHRLTNDGLYILKLRYAKHTLVGDFGSIEHQFLCNDGRIDCTDEFSIVHLKHLQFDTPVDVEDITMVPITGNIYVDDTEIDFNERRWGGLGCPVGGAKICLVDKSSSSRANANQGCVDSLNDGSYTIPATFGSYIAISVSFHDHQFEYSYGGLKSEEPDNQKGFFIDPAKKYTQMNFKDITRTSLEITVAGGICDLDLGQSKLLMKINGCGWPGKILTQPGVKRQYLVPANNLEVEVRSIDKYPGISFGFKNIDLIPVVEKNASLAKANNTAPVNPEEIINYLRYEYSGQTELSVEFLGNEIGTCENLDVDTKKTQVVPGNNVILQSQRAFRAIIRVQKKFGNNKICTAVSPDTGIIIHNSLGINLASGIDQDFLKTLKKSYDPAVAELFQRCNQGCTLPVVHDVDNATGVLSNARCEFEFMTGLPNVVYPYTKQFEVTTTLTSDPGDLPVSVTLYGQHQHEGGTFVKLPMYKPIMILRDPPGGSSFTTYENVETTIRLASLDATEYKGFNDETKIQSGAKFSASLCAGLGLSFCADAYSTKAITGPTISITDSTLSSINRISDSEGFTTTWSYSTSSSPLLVGEQADVFVVPNLNVKFVDTDVIHWEPSTCRIWKSLDVSFSLKSVENMPAISFLTTFTIENYEIPKLEKSITTYRDKLKDCDSKDKCTEYNTTLNAALDGLQGWQDALQLNRDTKKHAQAAGGPVKPNEWFNKVVKPSISGYQSGLIHNSSLLPHSLQSLAVLRRHYQDANVDLGSINRFAFSGGGTSFHYELKQDISNSSVPKFSWKKGNNHISEDTYGASVSSENSIFVTLNIDTTNVGLSSSSSLEYITDTTGNQSVAGFTFSDPDIGDKFAVEVFIDPHFGTFVFETTDGYSQCPHESGTSARAKPSLKILDPLPSTTVLSTEPMGFYVEITNEGDYPGSFVLKIDSRDEIGSGLVFSPKSLTIERLEPRKSMQVLFTVSRGHGAYEYDSVFLNATLACEQDHTWLTETMGSTVATVGMELFNVVDNGNKLVFAQPCPVVSLEGELERERDFSVVRPVNRNEAQVTHIPVSIRNPNTSKMRLKQAVIQNSTRLEKVELRYRVSGSQEWNLGEMKKSDKLEIIDFAAEQEDDYGYISLNWDISLLPDNEYEMQIRAVCNPINGAPLQFNEFTTESIFGVVDRTVPRLFGRPTPQKELPVGEDIIFEFDKVLTCSTPFLFDVELIIHALEDQVYKTNDLVIVCDNRFISIQFDQTKDDVLTFDGYSMDLTLSNVVDIHGNMIAEPISYSAVMVQPQIEEPVNRRRLENRELDEDLFIQASNVFVDMAHNTKSMNVLKFGKEMNRNFIESLREELEQNFENKFFHVVLVGVGLLTSFVLISCSCIVFKSRSKVI